MSKNAQILLENLIEQEFQNNDNYSSISDYFEFFSASQILKNQGLSDDEVDNGIVGKGLDGGCDSIYLFLNNLLSSLLFTNVASDASTVTPLFNHQKSLLSVLCSVSDILLFTLFFP